MPSGAEGVALHLKSGQIQNKNAMPATKARPAAAAAAPPIHMAIQIVFTSIIHSPPLVIYGVSRIPAW
jgi:hypothetical protein